MSFTFGGKYLENQFRLKYRVSDPYCPAIVSFIWLEILGKDGRRSVKLASSTFDSKYLEKQYCSKFRVGGPWWSTVVSIIRYKFEILGQRGWDSARLASSSFVGKYLENHCGSKYRVGGTQLFLSPAMKLKFWANMDYVASTAFSSIFLSDWPKIWSQWPAIALSWSVIIELFSEKSMTWIKLTWWT